MARPNLKPVVGPFVAEPEPPEEDDFMLMGQAAFDAGAPGDRDVDLFGIALRPENYDAAGAIQKPGDVDGCIAGFLVGASPTNEQLRAAALTGDDTLTPDPALAGSVTAAYSAAGFANERIVNLSYDGTSIPPGDASVVRGVFKGQEIIIFLDFLFD